MDSITNLTKELITLYAIIMMLIMIMNNVCVSLRKSEQLKLQTDKGILCRVNPPNERMYEPQNIIIGMHWDSCHHCHVDV